jgi:hypothetical protein
MKSEFMTFLKDCIWKIIPSFATVANEIFRCVGGFVNSQKLNFECDHVRNLHIKKLEYSIDINA